MDGGIATSDVDVPRESVGRNEHRLLADADHLIAVTKTVPVPGTPTVPGSIPVPITPTVPGSVPVPGAPTVHKTVPGTVTETVPETVPGTVPDTVTPSGILAVGNRRIARVAVPEASTHSSTRDLSISSVERGTRVGRAGRVWI